VGLAASVTSASAAIRAFMMPLHCTDVVRWVLQQRRADGQCSAVTEEMAPRGQGINHYLGFDGRSNWLARSYLGLDVGTAVQFMVTAGRARFDNRV
jgi:hypothetical protein